MSVLVILSLQIAAATSTTHCTGARRNEVCTEAGRQALLDELGVVALETETAAGVEVYGAFYLEGGGGLPAVSFIRRPGRSPEVVVSSGRSARMVAPVSIATWREVQSLGEIATLSVQRAAPSPRRPVDLSMPAEIEDVCLDGGALFAEVGRPSDGPRGSPTNDRLSVSNCSASPTAYFTGRLLTLAESYFPACSAISPDVVPGGAYRLRYCFRLTGDQMAAVEVMNRTGEDPWILDADPIGRQRQEWRRATGVTPWTQLTWAGDVVPPNPGGREAGGATDFLIARAAEMPGLDFRPLAFQGVSASKVEVTGEATYRPGEANDPFWSAPYRQTWERSRGQDWRVTIWTVDAFAPVR